MAWTYDQLIAEMHTRHQLGQIQLGNARTDINTAQTRWAGGDDHGAIDALMDAVYHNNQAIEDALASSYYGYDGATNLIPTALDRAMACPFITEAPPFDLTAIKICEAWAKDSFQERALTIAFIDRMRQLIWDEPFHVAWAARPESEGG